MKYKNGETQSNISNKTDNRRQIRDLIADPDGTVWGTTLNGLFCLRGLRRENLTVHNGLPCDGIFALVEDDDSAIWLYSRCGLIRIARSELDDWWQHPDKSVHTQLLDEGEGVQTGLTSNKPQAARTPDGRLWFVNGHVLQMIDINHLKENMTPPPVHVETVVADQREYAPRQELGVPALTRDLEIDYTAISFVAPLHFGLQGMRERAGRIGGKLNLVSSATFGTEIKLVVPGGIIFRTVNSDRRPFLTRLRGFLLRRYVRPKPD